jgi:hypothetical protein
LVAVAVAGAAIVADAADAHAGGDAATGGSLVAEANDEASDAGG